MWLLRCQISSDLLWSSWMDTFLLLLCSLPLPVDTSVSLHHPSLSSPHSLFMFSVFVAPLCVLLFQSWKRHAQPGTQLRDQFISFNKLLINLSD